MNVVLGAFGIPLDDATPELTGPPGQDSGVLLASEGFEPVWCGDGSWRWIRCLPDGGEILAAYCSGAGRSAPGWWIVRWHPEMDDECSVQLVGIPSERAAVLFSRMLPDPVEHGFRGEDLPVSAHTYAAILRQCGMPSDEAAQRPHEEGGS